MDFRIRTIRNHESLQTRQQDSMLSVLRDLTEMMKLSHQHFIDSQREREQTKEALYQISKEIKLMTQKTVLALSKISDNIQKKGNGRKDGLHTISHYLENKEKVHPTQNNHQNQSYIKQKLLEKSEQIMRKVEEINITPIQSRNLQIIVKSDKLEELKIEERAKCLKSYIARISSKVFSASFNMFFKEKVDFEKIKAYCSQNMLGNIIQTIGQNQTITADQIQMLDNHLSSMVLPFLKLSYPHSEEKETSSKLASLIMDKDIFNDNRFDIIQSSPIKKMTWHGLSYSNQNNNDHKTEKEFMRIVNYIIELPNQVVQGQKEKTLFDCFQDDLTCCFNIVFNKELTKMIKQDKVDQIQFTNQRVNFLSVANLVDFLSKITKSRDIRKEDMISADNLQKDMLQYKEKVKSYTKYKIGRKISANSKLYTQSQIQKGRLVIKDSSVRRIITKWIQSIQQMFQDPASSSILRNQLVKLSNGNQNKNQRLEDKQLLFELMKEQSKFVRQNFGKVKRNLYETFREVIIRKQYRIFGSDFCGERESAVGDTCSILSRASESYIIKYLVTLLNSLKKIEMAYKQKVYNDQQQEKQLLLVNLKLGDLMRCQLS